MLHISLYVVIYWFNSLTIKLYEKYRLIQKQTFRTKISPVVRLMSNLLFAGLSGSIPCPVRK